MAATKEKAPATWDSPEYAAACAASIKAVRVGYARDGGTRFVARLVHLYKRDSAEIRRGMIMSSSSGPKDYLSNQIVALFASDENIEQVAWLVLNRVPFLICKVGVHWYDLTRPGDAREVCVEVVKE